jgi:hypothetical protein
MGRPIASVKTLCRQGPLPIGFAPRVQFAPKSLAFKLGFMQTLLVLAHFTFPKTLQVFALIPRHIALAAHLLEHVVHFPQSCQ